MTQTEVRVDIHAFVFAEQDIFPVPARPNQRIPISRSDLFGTALLPGQSGQDIHYLSIDTLRRAATPCILGMGYTPARSYIQPVHRRFGTQNILQR